MEGKERIFDGEKEIQENLFEIAPNVWRLKDIFVNIYFIKDATTGRWVMVDAGLKTGYEKIKAAVEELFDNTPPVAILLTHGHFDHVGSLLKLASEWEVPVYAHQMEAPYLTGRSAYPPADPSTGGGLMSLLSFLFPNSPIDASDFLQELPEDGTVPGLTGWTWHHTPGHAPGHVSFFRESDKVLVAGDAVLGLPMESLLAIITQAKSFSGPPKYFTCDWDASRNSIKAIEKLHPKIIATGHGKTFYGKEAATELRNLVKNFDKLALPETGRYVNEPAVMDETGVVSLPPAEKNPLAIPAIAAAGIVAAGVGLYFYRRHRRSSFF